MLELGLQVAAFLEHGGFGVLCELVATFLDDVGEVRLATAVPGKH